MSKSVGYTGKHWPGNGHSCWFFIFILAIALIQFTFDLHSWEQPNN